MSSIKLECNSLLPTSKTITKDLAQKDKVFMVCILVVIGAKLAPICDQLLSSPTIPTLDEVYSCCLCVSFVSIVMGFSTIESSILVSNVQNNTKGE